MQITNNTSNYFIKKIARFDFDQFSKPRNRILLHLLMWTSFSILLFLSYKLAYQLSNFNALIFTIRMAVVNASVFYLFFYAILPQIISGKRLQSIFFLVFSLPLCILIWTFLTYAFSLLYHRLGFEVQNGELKGAVSNAAAQTIFQAISLKRMLSQTIIIISLLSPFFFIKILYEISKLYRKNLKIQNEKSALEIQNINIERDFLKAQLNPHFLFNTLNNLYGLALKKDDSTPEVILNLSEIMSYTLYESNSEKVPLQKELAFLKNYFELEKMRYPKDSNIHCEIEGEDQVHSLKIAPLLTFTFIENAFKYGLKSNTDPYIKMHINIHNQKLEFRLENDAELMSKSVKLGGIGIENIKKRLQLLYPNQYDLQIKNDYDKFEVSLKINLENQ